MWARPAVKKGADVPEKYKLKEMMKDQKAMEEHAAQVSRDYPDLKEIVGR